MRNKTLRRSLPENKKLLPVGQAHRLGFKALRLLFKKYPQMLLSRMVYTVTVAIIPYVNIYMSALIIDELAVQRRPEVLTRLVLITLSAEALIALIYAFISKWRDTQCDGMYFKVRQILTSKLLEMDFASVDNTRTHEMLSTIHQNENSGGWGLNRVISSYESMFFALFTVLGGAALSVSLFTLPVPSGSYALLNHPLIIAAVVLLMLVTLTSPLLSNKAGSYYALNADRHNLSNRLFSFFGYLGYDRETAGDVRIYRQDKICDRYNSSKEDDFGSSGFFAKLSLGKIGLFRAAAAAVSVMFTAVVYTFVCLKAWAGAFGVGAITQYVGAITKLSSGVQSLVNALGDIRNNASFLSLIFEFLDMPCDSGGGELIHDVKENELVFEFKNVSFKYPESQDYALRNISIKLNAGSKLAVVGPNGSGKTTFIKLLCRLYDPTEGEILLNGKNIKEYDREEYMKLFSVVFQDFKLFAFTLGQNVAAAYTYDRDRVLRCLEMAGLGEKLSKLSDGIDTYIYKDYCKDGTEISGGEAQKIAIARALYRSSSIIILDEPTASLDPVAESEIYSSFSRTVGSKTAIYISHRLSSCRFCDEVLVFSEGRTVQRGSHEQLLSQGGLYSELWHAQAQYYTE